MRAVWKTSLSLTLTGAALVAGLAGCRQPVGNSRLDRFLAGYAELPPPAREAALRSRLAAGDSLAALAHYALGNDFYGAAADSGGSARLDSARLHFQRAAALDSTFVEAWVNLGSVWDDLAGEASGGQQYAQRQERYANAETAYRRALALRPTDEKARCNLGALYVKQRRPAEALAQFKQALADNPRSALAHYNIAIMFAESKMYREAKREWEAAAAVDPRGDVGRRSRENVKIIEQMMTSPVPSNLEAAPAGAR